MKRNSIFLAFALVLIIGTQAFAQTQKPNIIYILADDLGYGDLGCFGQQLIETPYLDSLAFAGVRFTNHYAGNTVCAPSRGSLLTGLHSGHSPIRANRERFPEGQYPLPDSTLTIASLLQRNGYRTSLIGKWGLGYPYSTGDPVWQGFDDFYGYNCQRRAHHYFPNKLWENQQKVKVPNGEYSHNLFTDRALDFIRQEKEKPFFLYLAYTIPHAKIQIPEEYVKKYGAKLKQHPEISKMSGAKQKKAIKYASMVSLMDADIGRLVQELRKSGELENTVILFSSDNGPHSEGGANPGYFESAGGLRGQKRDLYEGGIRVPLIVYWKGHTAKGKTSDLITAAWDFFPTVCELIGAEAPAGLDGISIVPELLDQGVQEKHNNLYWEFHAQGGKQAVRAGNWKLLRLGVKSGSPRLELYNLKTDLAESNNLVNTEPQKRDELLKVMEEEHVADPTFKFPGD